MKCLSLLACVLSLMSGSIHAADVRVALPGGDALILTAPDGWRYTERPGPVPTLAFSPASGPAFEVLVSPLVRSNGSTAPADPSSIRQLVERAAQGAKSQAVERDVPIRELRSASVSGNYFSATDRAPKPGEYKNLTQGAGAVQGLPFTFTILSNGDPKAVVEPSLHMLEAARREQ